MPEHQHLSALVADLAGALREHGWRCVTAESCTGGGIAQALTACPGSSNWFEQGFVTYSNESKQEVLRVSSATLEGHGAVSEETAREMALGALRWGRAQIAIAVTGIAGPTGGSTTQPVGTVVFGWAMRGGRIYTEVRQFHGARGTVRKAAVAHALEGALARVREH